MQETVNTIIRRIHALSVKKNPCIVAIDGRCAAGKTTLASCLEAKLGCPVIHMDHFFLRPHQRTEERLNTPGGNIDYERIQQDIMIPLRQKRSFQYQPYDCHKQILGEYIWIPHNQITVVEGSYSCHPVLWDNYSLRIFMSVDGEKQLQRIQKRNGKSAIPIFQKKWIPLEESYFSTYQIEKCCDMVLYT